MSAMHILRTDSIALPWWRTDERFCEAADDKVWTDCCCCRQSAAETDCRVVMSYDPPRGGPGCYQEPPLPWEPDRCSVAPDPPTGAFYDSRIEVRCADGFGCVANPRKRRGAAMRWGNRAGC